MGPRLMSAQSMHKAIKTEYNDLPWKNQVAKKQGANGVLFPIFRLEKLILQDFSPEASKVSFSRSRATIMRLHRIVSMKPIGMWGRSLASQKIPREQHQN